MQQKDQSFGQGGDVAGQLDDALATVLVLKQLIAEGPEGGLHGSFGGREGTRGSRERMK
jgi:hypothetical protein